MTTRCLIAVSALALIAAPLAAQRVVVPDQLMVRVNRAYSPAVTAAVAKYGKPTRRVLAPGEMLREVIIGRCGTFDATYLAAFLIENNIPGETIDPDKLAAMPTGVAYEFPACLRSIVKDRVVKDNENPSKIYADLGVPFAASQLTKPTLDQVPTVTTPLKIGFKLFATAENRLKALVTAARGFDGSEAARMFAKRNADIDPTGLNKVEQSTLQVPAEKQAWVIDLRDDSLKREAKQALNVAIQTPAAAQGAPQPTAAVDASAGGAGDVTLANLIDAVNYTGTCSWKEGSPIPLEDLRNGREENRRLRGGDPKMAKVLVIDTGWDKRLGAPAIPEAKLGNLKAFNTALDSRRYRGFNPVDPDRYTDPTPPAGWSSAMHGGEVAATMLGGRFLNDTDRSQVALEVTFASLAKGTSLRAEGANAAIGFAEEEKLDIVNTSFVAFSPYIDFLRVLKEGKPPLLVIAAAGNDLEGDGAFADTDSSWPGRFGGEMAFSNSPVQILSVGAHGPDGKLLSFSKHGNEHVDLLAPGCNIPTYTLDADGAIAEADPSGTSFAAPIVTLIAGDLFREGLTADRVRNRLMASVDIDQALNAMVWTSGILNVRKALSVYRDLVEYNERDKVTGNVIGPRRISGKLTNSGERIICSTEVIYGAIGKFAFAPDSSDPDAPLKNYIFLDKLANGGHYLRPASCTPKKLKDAKPLQIKDAATGMTVDVPLADIIDFVGRSYDPKS